MCNMFIFSPLSLFSAPYIICLCTIKVSDARLLMIPSDRNLHQNELAISRNINKVSFKEKCLIDYSMIY